MIPLAAVLVLTVAAGPSDPPRRTGLDASNAARAKAGLLPRKAAGTRVEVRTVRTVRAPAPTFLGEPAAPSEGPAEPSAERLVVVPEQRLVPARGAVVTTVARELASGPEPVGPATEPARVVPPEEVGAVRFAAVGVTTELTLRMRFDE